MMVVVGHAILEQGGRPGRLNAPDEPLIDEDGQRVVDGLQRDDADLGPDDARQRVRGGVGMTRYGAQDGDPLRRYLDAALPEEFSRMIRQPRNRIPILEEFKYLSNTG